MTAYYVGEYKKDAPDHRGWIVGTFMDGGPRETEDVEVKYWELLAGDTAHPPKTSETLEVTLILSGVCRALLGDDIVELRAGNYFVAEPGTPNNTGHEVLEDVTGITIKAPSDPSAKKELKR